MADIKKNYEQMKKRYSLPDYAEINKEFEIAVIDKDDFLLTEIRKKIDEKLELFIKVIDRIIQPDTYIADMREQRAFDDDDKKELFELYKKIQIMHKESLLRSIEEDEKKNAEFINAIWKNWKPAKSAMITIVEKMRDSWKGDLKFDEETNYLG